MIALPPIVVLIACKVTVLGAPHPTTGAENLKWDTTESVMHCRRYEVPMMDMAEAEGADSQPFTDNRCNMSAIMLIPTWNMQHRNSKWRAWKVGCPRPIVDTQTGRVIGYKMPECGRKDIVECDSGTGNEI